MYETFVSLLNCGILSNIISNLMTAYMLNLCWSHGQNNMYVGVQVVHTFANKMSYKNSS